MKEVKRSFFGVNSGELFDIVARKWEYEENTYRCFLRKHNDEFGIIIRSWFIKLNDNETIYDYVSNVIKLIRKPL